MIFFNCDTSPGSACKGINKDQYRHDVKTIKQYLARSIDLFDTGTYLVSVCDDHAIHYRARGWSMMTLYCGKYRGYKVCNRKCCRG